MAEGQKQKPAKCALDQNKRSCPCQLRAHLKDVDPLNICRKQTGLRSLTACSSPSINPCQERSLPFSTLPQSHPQPYSNFRGRAALNETAIHCKRQEMLILTVCMYVFMCVCVWVQLCPTLCDPMGSSLPGSSAHGIFQARILSRVSISFSRGFSWSRDWTCISCVSFIGRWILYHCTWEALTLATEIQCKYRWHLSEFFRKKH